MMMPDISALLGKSMPGINTALEKGALKGLEGLGTNMVTDLLGGGGSEQGMSQEELLKYMKAMQAPQQLGASFPTLGGGGGI